MTTRISIFEDAAVCRLLPLAYFRPAYDLRCGVDTLREKIQRWFPKRDVSLHCRGYLAPLASQQHPTLKVNAWESGDYLLINGRVLMDRALQKRIDERGTSEVVYLKGDEVVAARVGPSFIGRLRSAPGEPLGPEHFTGLPREEVDATLVRYPWDLVQRNGKQIRLDVDWLRKKRKGKALRGRVMKGVHLVNRSEIVIGEGSVLKPGAVLDAEEGPIYIGANVKVLPHAMIMGPAVIGDGCVIKAGAQIYEDTTFGPVCKVGGEVEASIIQGYSNKQHAGFLGHAYLGSWVNLGADTNNSDLKNNYGTIRVKIAGEEIDTGLQFVGLTMGDHSKSAINTMFNTGTVVGVCSNIFGSDFPPKYVPSFSWGAAGGSMDTYAVDKAIDVARRVMARRKIDLSAEEETVMRSVFATTAPERSEYGMKG